MNADKNPDLNLRYLWLICAFAQKCHSGGIRAPASVVRQPIELARGPEEFGAPDDDARDVYALRPLRCSVYRASHNPN